MATLTQTTLKLRSAPLTARAEDAQGAPRAVVAQGPPAPAFALRQLPPEQDDSIQERLARLIVWGREAKLKQLVGQMQETPLLLPPETQETFNAWRLRFQVIPPGDLEQRALSLGILAVNVIQPALREAKYAESKIQFDAWRRSCCEILQQMLPSDKPVELFLKTCDIGLRKAKLFEEKCERADTLVQAHMDALRLTVQETSTHIEQECVLIKEQLTALQSARKQMHQDVRAQVEILAQQVEHLRAQMLTHAIEIGELGAQDTSYANLDACQALLQELL